MSGNTPKNRKERIEFICQKKGARMVEFFSLMTDREVKQFFDEIYPRIKDLPDSNMEYTLTCVRCGCEVEHHFECLCGTDRAVFDEECWKVDLEANGYSEMKLQDEMFVENGYRIPIVKD